MISLLVILGIPSRLFIALCVSLGPPKSKWQGCIKYARVTLEKVPKRENGRELGKARVTVRLLCKCDPKEREREGGLGRIFPDCFPREFGKAVRESLSKS